VLEEIGLFPATREGETQGRCLPVVTEKDIHDRSKSDTFTKAFAFIQCAWLVTQCITRAAVGLPLAELELMTLAFIIAALVMYGLWWHKPFDVQRATMLVCPHERASEVRSQLGNLKTRKQWRQKNVTNVEDYFMGIFSYSTDNFPTSLLFITVGTVMSSLHLAAWNWDFPSSTIRIIWRVFSVAATCGFPALYFGVITIHLIRYDNEFLNSFLLVLLLSNFPTYIISRLVLIFLAIYCFSSMPAAVYETTGWNTIFPHFS
jgi:hypothetical protein